MAIHLQRDKLRFIAMLLPVGLLAAGALYTSIHGLDTITRTSRRIAEVARVEDAAMLSMDGARQILAREDAQPISHAGGELALVASGTLRQRIRALLLDESPPDLAPPAALRELPGRLEQLEHRLRGALAAGAEPDLRAVFGQYHGFLASQVLPVTGTYSHTLVEDRLREARRITLFNVLLFLVSAAAMVFLTLKFVFPVFNRKQRIEEYLNGALTTMGVLHQVTAAANEAITGFEAIRATLDAVCGVLAWPLALAHFPLRGNQQLLRTGVVHGARDDAPWASLLREWEGAVVHQAELTGEAEPARESPGRAELARAHGLVCVKRLPIRSEGGLLAVLEFFHERPVSQSPLLDELFMQIEKHLAIVIERKHIEEEARRILIDQRIIADITRLSLLPDDLETAMNKAMEITLSGHGLGLEMKGSIFLLDDRTGELEMVAQKGLAPALQTACRRIAMGYCLCGRAAQEKRTLYVNHVDHRHDVSYEGMPDHGHYCVPIQDDAGLVGILNFYVPSNHVRSEVEDNFVTSVATCLAGVVRTKQAEARLRVLSEGVEQSPASVIITDVDGVIRYVNPRFCEITGYAREEVIGRLPSLLKSGLIHREQYQRMWETLRQGDIWRGEFHNRKKDGELYWESGSISPIKTPAGEITHFIAVREDVTLRKEYEEKLLRQATIDDLTGLPNRLLGLDRLRQEVLRAKRSGVSGALAYIDLDHFKRINDTMGHGAGDQVIKEAARRIALSLRECDTAARMGGDEFIALLPDIQDAIHVETICRRLLEAIKEPFLIDGHTLHLNGSIGVTLFPTDGDEPYNLLKNADTAMYRSKVMGRGMFHFFSQEMEARATEDMALENALHGALARGELSLAYQPQYDLREGRVVGAEALLRWNNGKFGAISPARFVPILEEVGLIHEVGAWCLRQACLAGMHWRRNLGRHIRVAVNLSSRQFLRGDLFDVVAHAIDASGLDPSDLELEVTEGLLLEFSAQVQETIHKLVALGVNLALDDFGTGYSSISYLRKVPFDTLKIDRSFVTEVVTNAQDATLVKSMVSLARAMDIRIVAEGVETEAQFAFLNEVGCHQVQGWFTGKPMSARQFLTRLKADDEAPAPSNWTDATPECARIKCKLPGTKQTVGLTRAFH